MSVALIEKLSGRLGFVGALKYRNYRLYAVGIVVSLVGTWMQKLAIGWLTWELTHSGAWLGIVAFADMFPMIVASPFGGAVADAHNRLRILKVTQVLSMIQACVLFGLVVTGLVNVWWLVALSFFLGIVTAFDQPARLALVSAMVPRPDLPAAVALNSVMHNTARFVGPAIAGPMLVVWGPDSVFGLNAVSFTLYLWMLWRIDYVAEPRKAVAETNFLGRVADGLRYAARDPGLRLVLVLMTALTVGVRPVAELLPGFAGAVFQTDARGLAIMTAAMGIGSVTAGLSINNRNLGDRLASLILRNSAVMGVAVLVFVTTPQFWVAVVALYFAGFGISRAAIYAQTSIHLSVDESIRGRVLAIYSMIVRGAPSVGALVMGFASVRFGLSWPLVVGVAGMFCIWLWVFSRRGDIAASMRERS